MDKYHRLTKFSFLDRGSIADIIWTSEGVKPLSNISFSSVSRYDINRLVDVLNRYCLLTKYSELKLEFESGPVIVKLRMILISLCVKHIQSYVDIEMRADAYPLEWRLKRYGRLFGYPVTTIIGLVQKKQADEKLLLPRVFTEEEVRVFLSTRPFRLSQNHWKYEALVVKKWIAILKKTAPDTYRHILQM